ncbi:hypothetical protein BS78_03G283200 [Paspalum vaginatum]|nr:hypothetical protein BS78_03G283200 [Paspalum vaginatum]
MAGACATPTRTPPRADWESAVSLVSSDPSPPVVLVCGPKNSGKFTFSRVVLNALLPRQAATAPNPNHLITTLASDAGGVSGVLDTDLGQPEFGPPGCLSLHVVDEAIAGYGSKLGSLVLNTTLREAERCYFFGDISSKRDPEAYLNCLFHLCGHFVGKYRCDENGMLPLIVNTPGWVKSAGFDMLVEMLRYICPTIVVQILITVQSKNLPDGVFWLDAGQTGSKMININAAFHDASNRL